ncbi:MAG: fibronectin type III domain-containing protein [Limisphaerales bacterium]
MKTSILTRPRGASEQASPGLWASRAALTAALLLLATANLSAGIKNGVVVGTVCGGGDPPYYGYVEGSPITSTDAQFHTPIGLAQDSTAEYLFVADRDNNAIRVVDLFSSSDYYYFTYTFAPITGFTPAGAINNPVGVALDASDNVYVLNRGNGNNGTVAEFDNYGDFLGANSVTLNNANAITLDNAGNVYLTAGNALIQIPSGSITNAATVVATATDAGANLQGLVVMDTGMIAACDSGINGNGIYLINPTNGAISILTGFNGAGDNNNIWTNTPNHPVSKTIAMFNQPMGLAKAGNGMLIVADYGNNRVKAVNSAGTVTNLYGVSSSLWYTGPGAYPGWRDGDVTVPDAVGDVEARLPNGVLFASDSTIYVTEDYYHLIRQVTGTDLPPVPPPPPTPPAAPTILSVTVLTNNAQISLTWSPVGGSNITYNVKRSTSSGGPYTLLVNTPSTNYTDSGVLSGTTYYYVVSAVGAGGEGPNSAQVSATLPLPPVADPQIGYVDFPATSLPVAYTSVFHPVSSFVANNDVAIVIEGAAGSQTFYTYGHSGSSIPDPTSASASDPVGYQDGMSASQVAYYALPPCLDPNGDLTIKAIGEKSDGSPNSAIVQARFQFITANPMITGNNAAQFTVSDLTTNAEMWYTVDGSTPTNGAPSVGPIPSGTTLSLQFPGGATNLTFKVIAFRACYQPSAVVPVIFSSTNVVANTISFGFASGEASSAFIGSPGQTFYAPVTLTTLPSTKMYSLQFNITVTNSPAAPAIIPGAYGFQSMLMKPVVPVPTNYPPGFYLYTVIPPYMFIGNASSPPPPNQIVSYDNGSFINLEFINTNLNLLGVGWLERYAETNLYDTLSQDLIEYSMAHDDLFPNAQQPNGVILGGYNLQIPGTAQPGQQYQIQLGRPSATDDGIGAPGSAVYIATPTNGSLVAGPINSIKNVTVGQIKYLVGDCAPFRWFNAGDFGDTNLDNSDVMQVFQSAIYQLDNPPPGSDFFDSMDSCGALGAFNAAAGYYTSAGPLSLAQKNALFNGNDTNINQVVFGDGVLDVCDVYVTFRRSLDPSLSWFYRFWTNGVRGALDPQNGAPANNSLLASNLKPSMAFLTNPPSVNFAATDVMGSAGQTVQVPITASIFGNYPLRVLMLNLTVAPLDGSPALTSQVQFTPNPALGSATLTFSSGNGNYAGTWLNSSIAGLTGTATLGTLTVTIPANASSSAAYAIHFDHASASPNGIASFPKQTLTGLILLSDRSSSTYNDGIPDSWRLRYFGTVNNLLSQASADADGDGANNWQEYIAGTDPTDPNSVLRVSTDQAVALQSQDCVVHWPSVAGKTYIIERSANLFGSNWIPVSTNTGSGANMEFHDTTGGSVRFYRVHVTP